MNNSTHKKYSVAFMFLQWQPKALLGMILVLSLGVIGISLTVSAQPKLKLPKNPAATTPTMKGFPSAQSNLRQKSILESLLELLRRKPSIGGSRSGDGFCGITPAVLDKTNVIWSDRPLFLWLGKVQSLELRSYKFDVDYEKQPLLWNFSPIQQQAIYPNKTLQAGQRYELQVTYISSQANATSQWQNIFQVMEKSERDRIDQELKSLEMQLKTQNATVEEIALARAHFFAAKDLWSDAIQQIYDVGYPLGGGIEFMNQFTEKVCQTKKTSGLSN